LLSFINESIAEIEPRALATGCLLVVVFVGSLIVWSYLIKRIQLGKSMLDLNDRPRSRWSSVPALAVVYIGLLMAISSLLPKFLPSEPMQEPPSLNLSSVMLQSAISIGLTIVLSVCAARSANSWSAIGMTTENLQGQVRLGILGFLATVLPIAMSLAATLPIRGADNQHSMLKLLMQSPDLGTVAMIAVAAAVVAPLFEELLYRVILQGWLSTLLPAPVTVMTVAVLFAFVHGWRDGLALIPLALILGYVFHRSHSYLSVVVIHALFNATMLALQLLVPRAV
jgi:membrane protease YdiL (CAAX protease family)